MYIQATVKLAFRGQFGTKKTVKPVFRGHLWDKQKVVFKKR